MTLRLHDRVAASFDEHMAHSVSKGLSFCYLFASMELVVELI